MQTDAKFEPTFRRYYAFVTLHSLDFGCGLAIRNESVGMSALSQSQRDAVRYGTIASHFEDRFEAR